MLPFITCGQKSRLDMTLNAGRSEKIDWTMKGTNRVQVQGKLKSSKQA